MSDTSIDLREAQFTFFSSYIRQFDPSATDEAIRRYLAEIETMALALQSLDASDEMHTGALTPEWPNGDCA